MKHYNEDELKLLTQVLPNVAMQLRGAMANVYAAANRLAPPDARDADSALDKNAAVFSQSYYQMYRVIGNLNDAAMLAETAPFTLYNDDVIGIFRSVCEKCQDLFAQKGVALTFESDKSSVIIGTDAALLERMLLNLLSNALKFTPHGGSVAVSVKTDSNQVALTVSDSGCGISSEQKVHLFEHFLEVDRLEPVPHGLGLGLALCRRIAEGHGGEISCQSEVGKGASFTVTLPNRKSNTVRLRDIPLDYAGGFNPILVQLSDALSAEAFLQKYVD